MSAKTSFPECTASSETALFTYHLAQTSGAGRPERTEAGRTVLPALPGRPAGPPRAGRGTCAREAC